jgi:hypothetical protein
MRRFLYVVLGAVVIGVLAHQYQVRIRHQMVDFDVYRTAGARVLAAQPLYRAEDGHYQFKYLPAFAVAMAPFDAMATDMARVVWFSLSVVWLVWLVGASVSVLPDRRLSAPVLSIVAVALMAKFFGHELTLGQANALLGALLITALVMLERRQVMAAAVLIGLSVFVKPYAVITWPWLAATRGPRAGVAAGAVIVGGLLVPAAIYGWHGNVDLLAAWFQTVSASTAPNLLDADNVSLAAMWAKWLGVGVVATTMAVVSAVGLLGLVGGVVWRRRAVSRPDYVDVAALMLVVPLLSPQGWDYVLLLGTPAVVCLVDRWQRLGAVWRPVVAVALGTMCLTTFDVMGRAAYGEFMRLSVVTVAAIAVVAALSRVRSRRLG